jgi:hypothetical protein
MATYYAPMSGDAAHDKVRAAIGYGRSSGWSWDVEVNTGEIYDSSSETGTRMVREGEVVDAEDCVWRVLMHGRAASQDLAKEAAASALGSLCNAMSAIMGPLCDPHDEPPNMV